MKYLEILEARMAEVEEQIRQKIDDPCPLPQAHISGSCDFVRQLLREAEAEGQNVEHKPDSPFYFLGGFELEPDTPDCFLGGFPIKADGNLPKNTFVIQLSE